MILALAGGVGGAKLAKGLAHILPPDELVIAVNTGDDFTHLGLHVSPDLDSVMYKLAGINDRDRGWGLADESWHFMDALAALGGETWFNLGDRDLATHVERTRRLAAGEPLSAVTADLCKALGIRPTVTPMTDFAVRTMVMTTDGVIPFQDYFVRLKCDPAVTGFTFHGIEQARAAPALSRALNSRDLSAIVICPSNPYVSIDPILAIPDVAEAVDKRAVPVVAVSPIIGGDAVKGPAAKMMTELDVQPSALCVADHYGSTLDGLVFDESDAALAAEIEATGLSSRTTKTLMTSLDDEKALAQEVLRFAESINARVA